MKYRWRGTWALSFFLASALFSRIVNQWLNWSGGTLEEAMMENLYFGIPLIASFIIIFVVTTKAIHKKSSDYRFPRNWLIKYNLVLLIKIIILFEVAGSLLIFNLLQMHITSMDMLTIYSWLLYAPIIALASILVFSLIPAIIILKTHPDKKTRKMLLIAFIVLSILIFVTALISAFTCQFGYAGKCLALTAINKQDISLCDSGLTESNKDKCYNYVIFHGNLELTEDFCNSLPRLTENCLIKLALETNNPDLCNDDNGCMATIALQTENIELCRILNNTRDYQEARRNQCIRGIAVKRNNVALCKEMTLNYPENHWIYERCISSFS